MNKNQLEEILTRPTAVLSEDIKRLKGDIMILGAGGKMGPSLAMLLQRTIQQNHIGKTVFAVSRFSNEKIKNQLQNSGITTIAGDLLDEDFLGNLPKVANIIYMAGYKFGAQENQSMTWAMNVYLPGRVAAAFPTSRIVAFSTGNIYPFVPVDSPGANESAPPGPVGEYAQSCLGRERIFEYFCLKNKTPILIYRLNYALDLRYGVLNDIARLVKEEKPIDLGMGHVNVIWQGDANRFAIRALHYCAVPASILNVTGAENLPVAWLANQFGELLGKKPIFKGRPAATALLNDARKAHAIFGKPAVSVQQMINWTVEWIESEGENLNKPTHFQERKGNF